MEINFYQIDDLPHKSIAPLLLKILEDKKKVLIYSQDLNLVKQLDEGLWSFSKTKFIPHASKLEKCEALKNPVFITNLEENENSANFLVKFEKASDQFLEGFEKIFYFFGDDNLAESKKLWGYYKKNNHSLSFYKKDSGKWLKVEK